MTVTRLRSGLLPLILKPKSKKPFFRTIVKQQLHFTSVSNYLVGNGHAAINDALTLSAKSKSLSLGTEIHGRIIKTGYGNDVFSQNNLINMYMKCGCLNDGLMVFDEMPERNLVSWTLVISGAVQNGECQVGLETFLEMRRNGYIPNEFALGSVMKGCSLDDGCCWGNRTYGLFGLCMHCFILKVGIEENPFVGSSILHMYAKYGEVEAAEKVFECVENSGDIGCWNAMIGGYAQSGLGFEAIKTLFVMHLREMKLDEFTYINSLNACSVLGDLDLGGQIHGLIVRSGMDQNKSVLNSLMDMYFKSDRKDFALRIFDKFEEKDIVSWNTVFAGFSLDGDVTEMASLLHACKFSGLKPNQITFSLFFRLCGEVCDLHLGLQLTSTAFQLGFTVESQVVSSMINMFCRCKETGMARLVFDLVPFKSSNILIEMISGYSSAGDVEAIRIFNNLWALGVETDGRSFSSTIEACFRIGYPQIGRQIHGTIIKSGWVSDGHVSGSLIRGYVKFGLIYDAFQFFNGIDQLNLLSYGTMMSALVHEGSNCEAIQFLNYMKKKGETPDDYILSGILSSCAGIATHWLTKSVHSLVIKLGFETNVSVASAAIDAYSKCGDLESAKMTFSQSSEFSDVILLNSMIMAYAHHGLVPEAVKIFEKIKAANLKPSQVTFVTAISACSHMGLVDLGRKLFKSIASDYGMEPSPDNYGCLVDLLSRYGLLEDAKYVMETMPFKPWPAIWRSLLNGCRIHENKPLGEWAARNLLKLVPDDNAAYILMSRIHSENGHWEDAAKVQRQIADGGVQKELGCSWIEI